MTRMLYIVGTTSYVAEVNMQENSFQHPRQNFDQEGILSLMGIHYGTSKLREFTMKFKEKC